LIPTKTTKEKLLQHGRIKNATMDFFGCPCGSFFLGELSIVALYAIYLFEKLGKNEIKY